MVKKQYLGYFKYKKYKSMHLILLGIYNRLDFPIDGLGTGVTKFCLKVIVQQLQNYYYYI